MIWTEWKRLAKNPKNQVAFLLTGLVFLSLFFYCSRQTTDTASEREKMYESTLVADDTEIAVIGIHYADTVEDFDGSYPAEIQEQMDYWKRDKSATQEQLTAIKRNGWQDELAASIKKDQNMLEGMQKGLIGERSTLSGDITSIQEVDNRIRLNTYLQEQELEAEYAQRELHAHSFLFFLLEHIFPILVPLLVCVICSDSISGDVESGSAKNWLLLPIRKSRILWAKIIANMVFVISGLGILVLLIFAGVSLVNGTGSGNMPVPVIYDEQHAVLPSLISEVTKDTKDYIPIGKALIQLLWMETVHIAAMICVIVSLSALFQSVQYSFVVTGTFLLLPNVLLLLTDAEQRIKWISYLPMCYGYGVELLQNDVRSSLYQAFAIEVCVSAMLSVGVSVYVRNKNWVC